MKTYYKVTCELYTEHVVPVLNAKQYDSGRGVDITLTDCGAVVVPAGADVCNLYCKKSDGTVSYISGTVTGDAVRVDFTNTLLAAPGIVECELEVTSGADTVSTPVFKMVVLPSNYDQGAIQSQDEFTALEDALAQLSNIGPAAAYDVANNLTTAAAGSYVLDAAQGKVLGDRLASIGSVTTGTVNLTECANSGWETEGNITLQKGYYIIFFSLYFSASNTLAGRRHAVITASSSSSTAVSVTAAARDDAVAGAASSAIGSTGYNATAQTTLYLRMWQNSGSDITPSGGELYAVKLA